MPAHVALFAESPSRMLVEAKDPAAVAALAKKHGVPAADIGAVGGDRLAIRGLMDVEVARLHAAWMSLEKLLGGGA